MLAAGLATIACGLLIYAVIVSETISPIGRVLEPIAFVAVPVILWVRAYRMRR
jgi:hypothetical protein